MPPSTFGLRVFRWLLRLYPGAYRRRYAREMEDFFLQERAASRGGPGFWVGLLADHVEAAWTLRRSARGRARERRGTTMARISEDLWFAARSLRRAPAFTVFAAATLALGIGATTAVFSVLDSVVLRPLPYPGSERMALVGIDARHDPGSLGPLSMALLERFQEAPGPAAAVVAAATAGVVLQDGGEPERTVVTRVARGFFPFFGARPAVGRLLGDADHDSGARRVAVLGHELWSNRYGQDPGVVGRSIRLDDEVFTVVGVLAPDFVPPPEVADERDLWIALRPSTQEVGRGTFFLAGVARLRPEATLTDLEAYADRTVEDAYGGEKPNFLLGATVRPYHASVVGSMGRTLGRVMAAVTLLLLIACVNVASLLLTRGAQRAHELAVRAALGASRTRMARQLLGESALVALVGGVVGTAVAWVAVELFRLHAPAGLPRLEEVAVDLGSLGFSLALGVVTVLLFGLLPALRSSGNAVGGAEILSRRATPGRKEGRLRGTLVATETALAVILTVGSALLAHDLLRIAREDPGFRPEGLVTMRLDLAPRFQRDEWTGVWDRLLEGARGLPGVTAAAVATQAPYAGMRIASTYRPEGTENEEGEFIIEVVVSGDYVRTLGARLVEGRDLTAADDGSDPVLLVNEAFRDRYWPGEAAVGKLVQSGGRGVDDEPTYRVVGVVSDVRTGPGQETPPHVFVPLAEAPWRDMELILRTDEEAAALVPAMRALVRRIDPGLPVTRIGTVESLASDGLARTRFYTVLFGGFGAVALLLAVVGVYGTTAYATRSRVREIGIRLALGAGRGRLVATLVARTGAVVGAGVLVGLAGAALGGRALTDVLTYVDATDGVAYGAVALVVLLSGLTAAWIPAGRAGRLDPASTLREEG